MTSERRGGPGTLQRQVRRLPLIPLISRCLEYRRILLFIAAIPAA
jgi:hypothetical protein